MKITLYPITAIGRLFFKLGLVKPTEIEISESPTGFEVKSNKPAVLKEMVLSFNGTFKFGKVK